jgi:hypothetical protein
MSQRSDRWWTVSSPADARRVAAEISRGLSEFGLPALEKVSSTSDLLQLWESGQSPGLTRQQAARYAAELRESAV